MKNKKTRFLPFITINQIDLRLINESVNYHNTGYSAYDSIDEQFFQEWQDNAYQDKILFAS